MSFKTKLSHPSGFLAWITVNGERVPIYKTKVEGSKAECWIESKTNEEFKIHCQFNGSLSSLMASAFFDGQWAAGTFLHTDKISVIEQSVISATQTSPFQFSPIQLTDDLDTACNDENVVKNLGTIKVVLNTVIRGRTTIPPSRVVQAKQFDERNKKAALAHTTGFGAPKDVPPQLTTSVTKLDELSQLVFHYRSMDLLIAQGIIPAPPPPEKEPTPAGPSTNPTNAAILAEENAELRREIERLRSQASTSSNKKVKLENSAVKVEQTGNSKRVLLDLSDDVVVGGKRKQTNVIDLTLD